MEKRVLFIYIHFYEYQEKIKDALISNGFEVEARYLYKYDLKYNLLKNFSKASCQEYVSYCYRKFLKSIEGKLYDYIFFVQAFQLEEEFVKTIKLQFPNSKFILYNWDSLRNHDYQAIIKYFDKIFSYDPVDCKKLKSINYLPLFYSSNSEPKSIIKEYDITFIGNLGGKERQQLIRIFRLLSNKLNLNSYLYSYIKFKTWSKLLLKGNFYYNVKFLPLRFSKMNNILIKSKAVIDMPNPLNNGLTMRTFETLGSKTKLITTNENILNEPFYNSHNIMVLTCLNRIDESQIINFLMTPFHDMCGFKEYHINNWIKVIFEDQ